MVPNEPEEELYRCQGGEEGEDKADEEIHELVGGESAGALYQIESGCREHGRYGEKKGKFHDGPSFEAEDQAAHDCGRRTRNTRNDGDGLKETDEDRRGVRYLIEVAEGLLLLLMEQLEDDEGNPTEKEGPEHDVVVCQEVRFENVVESKTQDCGREKRDDYTLENASVDEELPPVEDYYGEDSAELNRNLKGLEEVSLGESEDTGGEYEMSR